MSCCTAGKVPIRGPQSTPGRSGIAPQVGQALQRAFQRGLEIRAADIHDMQERKDGIYVQLTLRPDLLRTWDGQRFQVHPGPLTALGEHHREEQLHQPASLRRRHGRSQRKAACRGTRAPLPSTGAPTSCATTAFPAYRENDPRKQLRHPNLPFRLSDSDDVPGSSGCLVQAIETSLPPRMQRPCKPLARGPAKSVSTLATMREIEAIFETLTQRGSASSHSAATMSASVSRRDMRTARPSSHQTCGTRPSEL